jgi:hypothetical protein
MATPSTARGCFATARSGRQGDRQEVDTSTNYRARYDVESLTLHPARAMRAKEIPVYAQGRHEYAILPLYPAGDLTCATCILPGERA